MTPASTKFIHRLRKIIADHSLIKALINTTCAICTDDYIRRDELIKLPNCRHIFHRKCILAWFSRNNTCPLCRHVFPAEHPKHFSVPLTCQPPLCFRRQERVDADHVLHLHFHLRPLLPSNSDSSQSSPTTGPLQQMLVTEGYPELAARACGPFWISIEGIQPQ